MRWCDSDAYNGRQPPSASVRIRMKQATPSRSAYPDFLMHYGIFGQKWGIRRYQNEDGTLTEEGKLRYNKPESETWKKSDAEHLSDTELNRRNSRLQRERQYKDLTTSEIERERKQFRKDVLKKALIVPVLGAMALLGKHYITAHADKIPHLISKFGKMSVSKIKTGGLFKGLVSKSANNYSGARATDALKRIYNYRPRLNNAMPRMRNWPKL